MCEHQVVPTPHARRHRPHLRAWAWVSVGFLLGTIACGAASALAANDANSIYRKLEVLAQVLGLVENNYVDALSATDLVYGAARGAVATLDEHSAFFAPEEYRALLDSTEGEYVGVGIEIAWEGDVPRVTSVLEGSAARQAGLLAGDEIVAIDGLAVREISLELMHTRLQGPVGSKVVLTVRRHDRDEPWDFTLVRAWVRIAPIEARRLDGGVGYVRMKTFSRRVAADLEAQLAREPPSRGLVLDLRGNPGGLFDEAVAVCDLFLGEGPIVTVVGRGGRVLEHYEAHPGGTQPAYPLAILIDQNSASAAEVVAASLADRGRARLFGTRSYGKGSVQSVLDLSDGSGLKLTVARYQTPSGRQIDKHGIDPHEVVEQPAGDSRDETLAAALRWLAKAP
jgi:carboxyl-terminal processing protease